MKNKIRKLRIKKKITQKQLASIVGVSQQTISGYELELKPLTSVHNLIKIARKLDVRIGDLFY